MNALLTSFFGRAGTGDAPAPPPRTSPIAAGDRPPEPPALRRNLPRDLVKLARPGHWVKNLLVVPLALLGVAGLGWSDLARVGWAVLAFCLAASAVYVWNDIADRHRDRAHPVKRHRPVAAGRVDAALAGVFGTGLAGLVVVAVAFGPGINWWPLVAYVALNIAYSRWLKQVPLLDMFVVAAGFVLRVMQGYVALEVAASSWLLIAVFAVCLLLILGKRRYEVGAAGMAHRPALAGYSSQYLEYLMVLCGAVTVTAGLLYLNDERATTPHTDALLLLSVPFAIFGLARYLQLVVVRSGGGDPVRLLRDPVLLTTTLLWAAAVAAVMVAPHSAVAAISVQAAWA